MTEPDPRLAFDSAFDDLDVDVLKRRISEKWSTYPADMLPVWVAEMDFPLAEPIRAVLAHALENDDLGYPLGARASGLPEVFAERMASRFDWQVDPLRTEILSDVVQGLYIGLEGFSEPGEGAIVQTPIYPPFLSSVRETKRKLVESRLVSGERGWEIDFDALRRDVDASTRLLMFCNPHNPTGRVFRREELEALAQIACANDLVVISDEIHGDLVYEGRHHIPFASLGPEVAQRTITLTSATKAFNIPGLRCAVAHFGSAALQRRFNGVSRHVRGGLGLLGLHATVAAWRDSQGWLDEVVRVLERNRSITMRFLAERLPQIAVHAPEATYLAWLDCDALAIDGSPARHFMEEQKVALSEGIAFGPAFGRFARLNFATSKPLLLDALERVERAIQASEGR